MFFYFTVQVSNAGWFVNKGLMDTSVEEMDSMLNIFVRAVFTITQRALQSIIENKGVKGNLFCFFERNFNYIIGTYMKNTRVIKSSLSKIS